MPPIEEVLVRKGTAAEWADADASDGAAAPILADGEVAIVTDTDEVRIGDGETAFASLPRLVKAKARGTVTLVAGTENQTGLTGVVAGDNGGVGREDQAGRSWPSARRCAAEGSMR